jgi:AcrR family transcriptional regulator
VCFDGAANAGLARTRERREDVVNKAQQRERKASQRGRLIDATIEVVAEHGYPRASIGRIIAGAGVSRPTFYDYFRDREECFAIALVAVKEQLLGNVIAAVSAERPEHAAAGAVAELVRFAQDEPAMARALFGEAVAAGAPALDVRDQTALEIELVIEGAYAGLGEQAVVPDIPARIVLGAIYRLLGARLRRAEAELVGLREQLLRWVNSYARAIGEHRWRALSATAAPCQTPQAIGAGILPPPPPPPPRRNGHCAPEDAEQRRKRVLLALAELASERGYAAVTVADIGGLAGIEVRSFYRLFAGKHEAFTALGEFYFQHMMALTAGAFFGASAWPERVLAAKLTLAGCVEQNPALARACFVEAHAGRPGAAAQVEQLTRAFTLFLSEGQTHAQSATPYPPAVLEAIAHATFELVYHQARASPEPQMSAVLGHSLHLCLAPFIGPRGAAQLIDRGPQAGVWPVDRARSTSGAGRARRSRAREAAAPGACPG